MALRDESAHWGGFRLGLVDSVVRAAANVNDVMFPKQILRLQG
jgi:hypothetical protein